MLHVEYHLEYVIGVVVIGIYIKINRFLVYKMKYWCDDVMVICNLKYI